MALPERPTALVTGASSGIGRAIAEALARRGARLYLAGRDRDRLADVAEACAPAATECLVGDLTEEAAASSLLEPLHDLEDGLDVLVHSMGRFVAASVEATTMEELDLLLRTNFQAPFRVTQLLLSALRRAEGQVVFLNSSVIGSKRPGVAAYAASKQALLALADTLRAEVNEDGIRVLSIFPGRTATPMQAEVAAVQGQGYRPERLLQSRDVAEGLLSCLELPRTAEVTDLHIRPMRKG